MMLSSFLFLILSVFVSSINSSSLELGTSDFHSKIEGLDLVLVKFYATWCGHCKRLAPAYKAAAEKLLQNEPPITLVQVNCPDNEELCQEFGVTGYPTLKIFRKGKLIGDYDGARSEEGIMEYMIARSLPTVREVNSKSDLDKLREGEKPVFVAKVDSKTSNMAKVFTELADSLGFTYIFGMTTDKNVIGDGEKIVRFLPTKFKSKLDEESVTFDGTSDASSIKEWISNVWGGILPLRTRENSDQFTKRPLMIVYANVDYERDPKGTNYVRNRVLKAINEVKKTIPDMKYNFASNTQMGHELSSFGFEDSDKNAVHAVIYGKEDEKYKMTKEFSWENLKAFMLDYNNGKLETFVKSEPLETDEKTAVQRVVGKNFKELITNSKKDILLEFYAPWCGHCKNLKPIYEELAQKMSGEENIMIAAIDATANDYPSTFEVKGFPTIFWIPANGSPVQYQGERELDAFIKFITKTTTQPLLTFDSNGQSTKQEL